ncbi:hypothetical protein BHE74_00053291 [Ensete ventricosum]|nr:hypothetical protein BHE74_00053291 [Ensete ventricosum]
MDPNSKEGTVLRKRPLSVRTERKSGAHGSAEEEGEAAGAVNSEIMVVEEEPVSPLTRLFHQPCLDCYTLGIMGVGKPLDVDVVKSGLEATLVRHPCFSSIPLCSPPTLKARLVRLRICSPLKSGNCHTDDDDRGKNQLPSNIRLRAKATADRKKNSLEAIFTYKGAELIVKCFGIKFLTVHFQSYMNTMKIVITFRVDEAVISDVQN